MKGRVALLFAFLVALALVGSTTVTTATPPVTAPSVVADQAATLDQAGPAAGLVNDPYLAASPVSSAVPEVCGVCRAMNSDCAGMPAGTHCGKPSDHCRCSTCNGIFTCRPA